MRTGRGTWAAMLAAAALICTACGSGGLTAVTLAVTPAGAVSGPAASSAAATAPSLTATLDEPASTRVTVPASTPTTTDPTTTDPTTSGPTPESPAEPRPEPSRVPAAEPDPEPPPAAEPTPAADQLVGAPGPGIENASCPGVRCITLAMTGDVLLHPELVTQARQDGDGDLDFFPMLAAQQPYIAGADVGICHLETPLAPADGPFSGYPSFSVPPQVLPALVQTGYDACSTASNHTLDQGTPGIDRTLDDLDATGLLHDGSYRTAPDARRPVIINTPNGRVGFVSVAYDFNGLTPDEPWQANTIDVDAILAKAHAAKAAGADLVVVAMHGGDEYDSTPNAQQKAAAKRLLASPDVDLVYGHHAHVVQPMEKIDGKWAIYGLGNNIAAQGTEVTGTRDGLLVRVQFSQAEDGTWSTGDVGWVASYQDLTPPYRWCPLTSGTSCGPEDAASLARTTTTVNAWGAAGDGAHRLD